MTVLGPVRVWRAGTELSVGSPQARAVLAILLARVGQPVTMADIVEVLWGQRPPATAVNAVHGHVAAVRRALDPGRGTGEDGRLLVRRAGGYYLQAPPDAVDLVEFRRTAGDARRLSADGDLGAAIDRYLAALRLWTGPCASNVLAAVRAHPFFAELERECVGVAKDAADTALRVDQATAVLPAIQSAADADLFDEPLQARLVLLLAAAGRQADALARFARIRAVLADELGIDPGAELVAAQQDVLRQPTPRPPTGPVRTAVDDAAPVGTRAPAQLPHDLATFTGRVDELRQALSLVPPAEVASRAALIQLVTGMGGVGKTTLALHLAHQLVDRFPDGQLFVNLRGFDADGRSVEPADALGDLLEAVGVAPERIPQTVERRSSLYRSMLAGRRMLIVLDNARDADQVRPLLPGSAGCLAIVTSRNHLAGLVAAHGAHPLALRTLSDPEAFALLSSRLGDARVRADAGSTNEVIRRCQGLPLALAIVAARALMGPSPSLTEVAADLAQAELDAFTVDETTGVRAVFLLSYQALSEESARLYRLLGHARIGADVSFAAMVSLAGTTARQLRPRLDEILQTGLITRTGLNRYRLHDLIAKDASERSDEVDGPEAQLAALGRLLDHYVMTAMAARLVLIGSTGVSRLPAPEPGTTPERIDEPAEAMAWLAVERSTLLVAIDRANRAGMTSRAGRLALAIEQALRMSGHRRERLTILDTAASALQQIDDHQLYATVAASFSQALAEVERYEEAARHLARAREVVDVADAPIELGRVLRSLANLADRQGRVQDHLEYTREALDCYTAAGDRAGEAFARNSIGNGYLDIGEPAEAMLWCEPALRLFQELGNRSGEAATWDTLGTAHRRLGHLPSAVAAYQAAIDIRLSVGDRSYAADSLRRLGETRLDMSDIAAARVAWQAALDIMEETDHRDLGVLRAKLHALAKAS